ncbi:YCF48-related protein [Occallatibacter riparius]|uniref:YCF48-related protein n=1 Tax=Occallatibacter riparius TaxID=1002689 RepID=A0A9J7BV84_9BACT|nr:YCF48-related protein [Occallatibacter riparius]UWZ86465.1 YCF48-related protein [Occallatibacter riparius]
MKTRNLLVLFLGCAFTLSPAPAQVPAGWVSADPGFAPLTLIAKDGSMWAAGTQQSIAVSSDGGVHWALKHHDANGAVLRVLHFVNKQFGYAAGSGGVVLFTRDGGATWSGQKLASESILLAAFGDPQNGVIRTRSSLLSTTDGGKTWHPITAANDPDWQKKFPFTIDLAALDKNHLAVLVAEGENSDGEYLWTADGGATWRANYLPNVGIHNLLVADGAYYSIGHEVIGKDKPGGGNGVAMTFRSHDGAQWEHVSLANGPCNSESCGGCTPQGCMVRNGSAVDLGNGKTWLAEFPPRDSLSDQWARSGDSLCMLSRGSIQCAAIKTVSSFASNDQPPGAWESRSLPRLGLPNPSDAPCIRCDIPPMFVSNTAEASGPVDVQINFTVEPSGGVDNVRIVGKLPRDVIEQLQARVTGWLFEPFLNNGIPARKDVSTRGRILILNPRVGPK